MLVGELPLPTLDRIAQRHGRVDIDHSHRAVAALHRHADRLTHACSNHAVAAAEAVVVLGVAGDDALAPVEHVVEDRATDGHRCRLAHAPVAAGLRAELLRLGVEQHDAATVRLDPFEDKLQNPAEEFVDVERVADRKRRAIHHLQVAPGPRQPAILRVVGKRVAADVDLVSRPHDP